jgi:hypothetical protein
MSIRAARGMVEFFLRKQVSQQVTSVPLGLLWFGKAINCFSLFTIAPIL